MWSFILLNTLSNTALLTLHLRTYTAIFFFSSVRSRCIFTSSLSKLYICPRYYFSNGQLCYSSTKFYPLSSYCYDSFYRCAGNVPFGLFICLCILWRNLSPKSYLYLTSELARHLRVCLYETHE